MRTEALLFYSHKKHRRGTSIPASILLELFCSSGRSGRRLEKGRGGAGVTGARASLKSGFQLNPWLSSKRRRKMTEVHDMARSPRPAKPFHFSPFVCLQLLIFMIAQPSRSPHHTRTHSHPLRNKKKYTDRTLNQNPKGFLSSALPKTRQHRESEKLVLYRTQGWKTDELLVRQI